MPQLIMETTMNKLLNFTVLGSVLLLSACATGAGNMADKASAANLEVVEKVTINAPAAKVWEKVSNFGDLGAFHPAVAKTEIKSGTNNVKGAVRLLTLGDGGTVNETLTNYDAASMSYSYIINESVLPVSHYSAKIDVNAVSTNVTEVVWNANFARKDPSATPAKGQDDEAATGTIHGVFKGGLDNLKKITE
jgi:mxaD protein